MKLCALQGTSVIPGMEARSLFHIWSLHFLETPRQLHQNLTEK